MITKIVSIIINTIMKVVKKNCIRIFCFINLHGLCPGD